MIFLLPLLFAATQAQSTAPAACIDLQTDLASFVATIDFTALLTTGRLAQSFCAGTGYIVLGSIDAKEALLATTDIVAPAQYVPKTGAARRLSCSMPKESFAALAQGALNKAAPIAFDKIKITCSVASGAVFAEYLGSTRVMKINEAALTEPEPTATTTKEGDTTPATTTVAPAKCDDVKTFLDAPLKLLLGATLCLPPIGKFVLHKIDLAQVASVNDANPAVVSGEFVNNAGASIAVKCKVAAPLVRLLLPLAQSFDVSRLDTTALANALDITCVDSAGAHTVVINKDVVQGVDASLLTKVFKLANIDVNTGGLAYKYLTATTLQVGPFKIENGKLVTPFGTFDAGAAVEFLKDVAIVKSADGKVLSLSTPAGTVQLGADGRLVFIGADGKQIVLSTGCIDIKIVGGSVSATCDKKPVSFTPGGLLLNGGKLTTPDGAARTAIGAFKVPENCAADAACLARVLSTARDYLAKRGCTLAQQTDLFQVSCDAEKKGADAELLLAEVVQAVNVDDLAASGVAKSVDVPKPESTNAKKSTATSTQASLIAAAFVVLATMF